MIFSIQPHSSSLPGADDITREELSNGIVVLTRPNFNSPSVVISGYLPAGGIFDPQEKLGLADFTAAALMRGTAKRDFQGIYDALESAGASLGFSGATHTVSFGGKSLAEDLPLLMELLAASLLEPVFPGRQIARLRARLLTGLALRAQDTRAMASLTFDQITYKDHPYRNPEDGYPETVEAITRDDLAAFHQKHYGPRGMVIAIVGAVTPQDAVQWVRAALGDWQNPEQPEPPELPPVPPLKETIIQKVEIPGKSQSDLVMGVAGPPRSAEDFIPASLGNSVLGQFGLMGRIGDVVREQSGLAYYAYSSLSGGMGPGPWSVSAGVAPENVEKAIELIRSEVRRFVNEPVSEDELNDSKANFIGRLPLALESNGGVAGALLNLERYNLGLDYYRNYAEQINAISVDMVLSAAQRYLDPERLAVAVAGP
ncbi:MAG TPA: insulinase family protein [Anaerolineales bacterium]|nr:insulinase family protein [Anaerolineales bacterium]